MKIKTRDTVALLRTAAIGVVLAMAMILPNGNAWAGNRSAPDVSPHLQRPPDIPLERLDRPQRLPGRLNVNRASPHQLKTLPGLSEAEAESISRGRPYKHKDELVTREILSQSAYDKIKDLITAE
jgi:competence protein ComEA